MSDYDNDNVFAKILREELPSETVYEDDLTRVIMDIMPRSQGHCLVLPKAAARNILDVDRESLAAVALTVQKMARACMKAFSADGITIQQFNEPAGGQEVYHLHFHVIPRFEGVRMDRPGNMADAAVVKANADRIRAALADG